MLSGRIIVLPAHNNSFLYIGPYNDLLSQELNKNHGYYSILVVNLRPVGLLVNV